MKNLRFWDGLRFHFQRQLVTAFSKKWTTDPGTFDYYKNLQVFVFTTAASLK